MPPTTPEDARFAELQRRLRWQVETLFADPKEPRTVVVVPSLSVDAEVLASISGVQYYEERLLCLLMLLRLPRTKVIFVTSQPVHQTVIDYYLHLLPGVPTAHALSRLELFCAYDASPVPLTQKILERPRLLERIRTAIPDLERAHMTCFNVTELERSLSLKLGIPLYGCDPSLLFLGSKSGSRQVFKEADVPAPAGFEGLRDEDDLAEALATLKGENPDLRRAAVKLNEGFSGKGNAVFSFEDGPERSLKTWVAQQLERRLEFEAQDMTWEIFLAKFRDMTGVAEAWIVGEQVASPSVQCRINPLGQPEVISTHDQVLGGPNGQVFIGATFPAAKAYRLSLQEAGLRVARVLAGRGVVGRFGVDFISVKRGVAWEHFAIEINLRKGGTTHPFLMLQYLTDGHYDAATGEFKTPDGQARSYYAVDNLHHPSYQGLTPGDLIDIAVVHNLHFHGAAQQGVVFHLIGALSEFGKLGVVCVGDSLTRAKALYKGTVDTLNRAVGLDEVDLER